jgi:GNAT superfamily N-acetyltransferase
MAATVRRLGPDEWPLLRTVRLRALRDVPFAFGSTYEEESIRPDDWWETSTATLAWFVAETTGGGRGPQGGGEPGEEGDVVGLAAGWPGSDPGACPEVISMWVAERWRGTGVGDALLSAVIDWAVSEAAAALCLGVAEGNDRARRFYERAGFRATGRGEPLRSRPEVHTWQMRLDLAEWDTCGHDAEGEGEGA